MRSGASLVAALMLAAIACTKPYGETTPAAPTGDDDDEPPTTKVTTTDAGAGAGATSDASTGVDAGPQASTTCPGTVPATTPPFNVPQTAGSTTPCTQADITLFLANEGQSFAAEKATMAAQNPLCAACVFTLQSDASWGPIVGTDDGRRFVNFGLCYAVGGTHQACAKDAFDFEWCRQKVCNVCLSGENPSDCLTDAQQNLCNAAFKAANNDCGQNDSNIISNLCGASGDVVQTLCGPANH